MPKEVIKLEVAELAGQPVLSISASTRLAKDTLISNLEHFNSECYDHVEDCNCDQDKVKE